jgi:hypothetical protein
MGRRPLPPNPHPQSLKGVRNGWQVGALSPALPAPLRVGRGDWGEGRDLRSLALPSEKQETNTYADLRNREFV